MLHIDGSQGEGGGQILRSAVALSAVTRTPVRITKIRADRRQPGLRRQHLTAMKAAAAVCGAELTGAALGSTELAFVPGKIQSGDFAFQVGTAGSTTLVLQTLLPALVLSDGPSTVTITGGTHNPLAPPYPFLERAYVPLLNRMGANVTTKLVRPGFYPAGGGEIEVRIEPCEQLRPLELLERGKILRHRVRAICAKLPESIGHRECRTIQSKMKWDDECFQVEVIDNSPGPGNVVVIEVESENVTEVFTGFGQVGRRAEHVAKDVAREVQRYIEADVPVGSHLADQLMLPLAIGASSKGTGGGSFRTLALSRHSTTHVDIIRQFLDIPIDMKINSPDDVTVRFSQH